MLNLATRGCHMVNRKFRYASTLGQDHLGQRRRNFTFMGPHNNFFRKKIRYSKSRDTLTSMKRMADLVQKRSRGHALDPEVTSSWPNPSVVKDNKNALSLTLPFIYGSLFSGYKRYFVEETLDRKAGWTWCRGSRSVS